MSTANRSRFNAVRIWRRMMEDLDVVLAKDPAPRNRLEVLLYPHIHALWTYRVAHCCYVRGHTITARALSMAGRWVSGIEIHPGAVIGRRFFIDHGSAVVIGETVRIGDDVMLYHQVTLGSVGWWRDKRRAPGERRHPILEDSVIIGTNVSVLGPVTIGTRAQVGAHAVVTESVPPDTKVAPPRPSSSPRTCPRMPPLTFQDATQPSADETAPYGRSTRTPITKGGGPDQPTPVR